MPSNGQVFRSTPEDAAQLHPWVGSALPTRSGMPLGKDLKAPGRFFYFDPPRLKDEGKIDSMIFALFGIRGFGKSAALKILCMRLLGMQAGYFGGRALPMTARIHDRKPEDGRPEFEALTKHLMATVIELNRHAAFNLFDPAMNMDELDLVETAINVCEMVANHQLTGLQPLALQVGVHLMLQDAAANASPEVLELITRGLTVEDVNRYYATSNSQVFNTRNLAYRDKPELLRQLGIYLEKPPVIPKAAFEEDAIMASSYLGRILRGDYGRIFGGRQSLRDALSQPLAVFDWSGVNDRARMLLEAMLWKWQEVALTSNDLTIIPRINIGDEEHEMVGNRFHMRSRSAFLKKARAYPTMDFMSTQFEQDFLMAGNADSELRELARSIVRSISGRFYFRQPPDDEVLHAISRYGVSDEDVQFLTTLPKGACGLKLADHEMIFFQIEPTAAELAIIPTDAATTRMLDRTPVDKDPAFLRRQAILEAMTAGVTA
jgi:hypothetical protein